MDLIPYGRQSISQEDIDAVVGVLRSDFLTQGPAVPAFEKAFADYCGVGHGVAVNSATSALHIACLALGVGPGDLVWTSPISFVASSNCALYCGADVDFVDIDPRTYNMSPDSLSEKLEQADRAGRLPQVVIPVHLAGQSCDMASIGELARRYGFRVIEDASHAVGARYCDTAVGSCAHSDISIFSFHPVKIVTTGEGGLVLTASQELARHMELLRSHCVTRDVHLMEGPPHGAWYYEQIGLGYNYRMTDIQAALGLSQFRRLNEFIDRRRALAARYDEMLASLSLTLPWQHPDTRSSYHLYVIRLKQGDVPSKREVFERLQASGIGVNLHYMPIYLQPHYRRLGFDPGRCPQAERYYEEAISIPLFPSMTEADQDRVVEAICKAIN